MDSAARPTSEAERSTEFDEVVLRETRRLHSLAVSILYDDGEAEDAVQETFVRGWRAWRKVSSAADCGPWLTRICVNYCISRRRHRRTRARFWQTGSESAGATEGGISPSRIDIDTAYRRLPVRQRAALTLTFRYGYSAAECAEIMSCRPGTVRSHLARALASLRKEIDDE
ncbi:MAG: RNA polymerase sigma factor [Candidatus Dormibacteria bacterium]